MSNDMLKPSDMAHLPGAPFTDDECDAAVATLRTVLGWHVAPVRTETITVDVAPRDDTLRLPTRQLGSVNTIENADTGRVFPPNTYRVSHRRGRVRRRGGWWPAGFESVDVELTHGFDECPPDLLSMLGQLAMRDRRDRGLRVVSVDDASTTFASGSSATAEGVIGPDLLGRYRVPEWSGMA